jgi:hypothetical protein
VPDDVWGFQNTARPLEIGLDAGAADAHNLNAQQEFIISANRGRNLLNFDLLTTEKYRCLHRELSPQRC